MQLSSGKNAEDGFTLLETLIAFLILSLVVATATQTIVTSAGALRKAGELSSIDLAADMIFAEKTLVFTKEPAMETGITPDGLSWSLVRKPVALPTTNTFPAIIRLTLTFYSPTSKRPIRSFTTFSSKSASP